MSEDPVLEAPEFILDRRDGEFDMDPGEALALLADDPSGGYQSG